MRALATCLIISSVMACTGANAAAYKWKDANGTTHYSDQAPPEAQSKRLPLSATGGQPELQPNQSPRSQTPARIPSPVPHGTNVTELLTLQPSGFANLNDITALPYVNEAGRAAYKDFLQFSGTRAFLVCSDGSSVMLTSKTGKLFENADKVKKHDCKPYAVNDAVVWVASSSPSPAK